MKIALTGHRPERLNGHDKEVREWIRNELNKEKYIEAYSGMARGADIIFAQEAIKQEIPLICCFPFKKSYFKGFENIIMNKAEDVRFISDNYSNYAYWLRDKYMVDNCDILLAVWDGRKVGGTYITVKYAEEIGKKIIYFPREILRS